MDFDSWVDSLKSHPHEDDKATRQMLSFAENLSQAMWGLENFIKNCKSGLESDDVFQVYLIGDSTNVSDTYTNAPVDDDYIGDVEVTLDTPFGFISFDTKMPVDGYVWSGDLPTDANFRSIARWAEILSETAASLRLSSIAPPVLEDEWLFY